MSLFNYGDKVFLQSIFEFLITLPLSGSYYNLTSFPYYIWYNTIEYTDDIIPVNR